MMDGMGVEMGLFGIVFMLLIWVLIIAGIIALVRWLTQPASDSQRKHTPLEILQGRFARGDIDQDEFEKKKKVLHG